ncbi:hypothetical protein EBT31_06765, partial [bacterium]|nr:hypothetical protein [bacterium]
NAAWTKLNATVTANATASPDGTVSADLLTATSNAEDVYVILSKASSAITYTLSVFVKNNVNANTVVLYLSDNSTGQATGTFDLSAVTATTTSGTWSGVSASISSVGSGWFRCTLTATSPATSGLLPGFNWGSSGSAVYIWGAQLEVGSTATGYMVSGVTNGFRAVPVVSGSATARGLLVEEQRVNSMTYSDDLSNAAWSKSGATVSAVENSATSNHEVFQSVSITSGTTYTLSFFAKAAGRDYVACGHNGTSSYAYSYFNLANGTVVSSGSGHTTSIQSFGNGWYRVTSTFTAGVTASIAFEILASDNGSRISYTGDGSSGILVWGAQLEAGSFATSYIPTLASTVTRSADVASVNTLSPWFDATEMTVYTEYDIIGKTSAFGMTAQIDDGSLDNRIVNIGQEASGSNVKLGAFMTSGGSPSVNDYPINSLNVGSVYKLAFAVKSNDAATVANGTSITDGIAVVPSGLTTLRLGRRITDGYLNGHLRRIAYYPRRLTNAELQALTA